MSKLQYEAIFQFGQIVYLVTDIDQKPRQVVKHVLYPDGSMLYGLAGGTLYSEHYEIEISENKDFGI